MRYLILIGLSFLIYVRMAAQVIEDMDNKITIDAKTTYSDSLEITEYMKSYYFNSFLEKQFDYERINKAKKLKRWSKEVSLMGIATCLGITYVSTYLAEKKGWNLWIEIPCVAAVSAAAFIPFYIWSNHLKKKADALNVQSVYIYNIDNNIDLGAVRFTNPLDNSYNAVGFSVKVLF